MGRRPSRTIWPKEPKAWGKHSTKIRGVVGSEPKTIASNILLLLDFDWPSLRGRDKYYHSRGPQPFGDDLRVERTANSIFQGLWWLVLRCPRQGIATAEESYADHHYIKRFIPRPSKEGSPYATHQLNTLFMKTDVLFESYGVERPQHKIMKTSLGQFLLTGNLYLHHKTTLQTWPEIPHCPPSEYSSVPNSVLCIPQFAQSIVALQTWKTPLLI